MLNTNELLDIDEKTLAVFRRKGYQLKDRLGEGAFGMV